MIYSGLSLVYLDVLLDLAGLHLLLILALAATLRLFPLQSDSILATEAAPCHFLLIQLLEFLKL